MMVLQYLVRFCFRRMFTKLTSEPYLSKYSVEILSSPHLNGGPWVITMENVLSETEAEQFIELGDLEGYKRSADVGDLKADGTYDDSINEGRTSTNAWCEDVCYYNETAINVTKRISDLVGIPESNSEFLQLLKYEPGQFYQEHHDYIEHEVRNICMTQ